MARVLSMAAVAIATMSVRAAAARHFEHHMARPGDAAAERLNQDELDRLNGRAPMMRVDPATGVRYPGRTVPDLYTRIPPPDGFVPPAYEAQVPPQAAPEGGSSGS